jgi:hypothetical protein
VILCVILCVVWLLVGSRPRLLRGNRYLRPWHTIVEGIHEIHLFDGNKYFFIRIFVGFVIGLGFAMMGKYLNLGLLIRF